MSGTERQHEDPAPAGDAPWFRMSAVFHPFDPAEDNQAAFVHALRLAWFARARLNLMCLRRLEDLTGTDRLPRPQAMLEQWSGRSAARGPACEDDRDLSIQTLHVASQDPVRACVHFLKDSPADLIVLTAPRHQGKTSWLHAPAAEMLARKAGEMTLFVPQGARGFVSSEDGAVSLKSILVPVAAEPSPAPAIEAARRVMLSVPQPGGTAVLLHAGDSSGMPVVRLPDVPGWTWQRTCRQGDVAGTILETAAAIKADLIAMATFGTHGFLDAVRGSVSRRVLGGANCPLLSMPQGSFLG
jgi:hypothetical protein